MRNWKVEKDFMIDDYRCVIVGVSIGHRCGYVGLPKGHKYEGKDYDEIDVEVHGGLTYAGQGNKYPVDGDESWIGFDYAHCGDAKDLTLVQELNDEHTYDIIRDIETKYKTGGEIRTTEYVENELIQLVRQLQAEESSNIIELK